MLEKRIEANRINLVVHVPEPELSDDPQVHLDVCLEADQDTPPVRLSLY